MINKEEFRLKRARYWDAVAERKQQVHPEEAGQCYLRSARYCAKLQNWDSWAEELLKAARCYISVGRFRRAERLYQRIRRRAHRLRNSSLISTARKIADEARTKKEDVTHARVFHRPGSTGQ